MTGELTGDDLEVDRNLRPQSLDDYIGQERVRDNLATLRSRGVAVMDCGEGELACGTEGRGRMPEPSEVLAATEALLG